MNHFNLSFLDQTMLRVYVRHLHIFQISDSEKTKNAVRALRKGLLATLQEIPIIGGSVSPTTQAEGSLVLQYPESISDKLVEQLLSVVFHPTEKHSYSFQHLEAEGFSPYQLPGDMFCPELLRNNPGLDDPYAEGIISFSKNKTVPVLAAQANFISGGLVLSVYTNHSVMDGIGIAQFYRVWASHVGRNAESDMSNLLSEDSDPFKIVDVANMQSQRRALDVLASSSESSDCPEVRFPGTQSHTRKIRSAPYKLSAKLFVFSSSTIMKMSSELSLLTQTRISNFVALIALVWTHITLARASSLRENKIQETKLVMAFDHRKNLQQYIGEPYLGNCATGITASHPISDMFSYPSEPANVDRLSSVAKKIAETLSSTTLDWLKPRLSLFARTPNPHHLGLDVDIMNGPDLFVTSWMHIGTDCVWNIPGITGSSPKAIRKPQSKVEGNIHILPRMKLLREYAPFEVMVCLEKGEMNRLETSLSDEGWIERIVNA
jgi:trichothecene 3-O-acetyltransferase